jgi:hypothetical protein
VRMYQMILSVSVLLVSQGRSVTQASVLHYYCSYVILQSNINIVENIFKIIYPKSAKYSE